MLTNQKDIRAMFWNQHREFRHERRSRKSQNDYRCDIRISFVDFLDNLHRNGQVSDAMAAKATL